MIKAALKHLAVRTILREGTIRYVLRGRCRGLRYRIFAGYGLSPILGGWEPDAQRLMADHIRAFSVVYDIGANYGMHTLLMARLAQGDGHVYAFEPVPEIFGHLRENIALNAF